MGEIDDRVDALRRSGRRVGTFTRIVYQFTASAAWAWQRVVRPAFRVLTWPLRVAFRLYMWAVWNRLTKRDGKFSTVRGGVVMLITGVLLYFAALPVGLAVGEALLYALTAEVDHEIYLTDSQETGDGNHDVKGCAALPCSDENSVYYKIESTLFSQAWSVYNGHGIFFPDAVAGSVLNEIGKCVVTSYGVRMKTFTRLLEVYPKLLAAECRPLPDSERG